MELLAPAGNLEKLQTAVRFGADAVYCGAGTFSLRSAGSSFTLEELEEGIKFAHSCNTRVYLAMNLFAFDEDLPEMQAYYDQAIKLGIDAIIVSDPGLVRMIRKKHDQVHIHLSTQANTTNSESVRFWLEQGVNRIIMAREVSLKQISIIKEKIPGAEIEVFVHGAMCIAYSGRCLLSRVFNDRSANRGLCTQPCRWEYQMREVNRDERMHVTEEAGNTYILNSRDLCMIEHIPALAAAGVDSLKIEGRMKTAYYVAAVTRIYRIALDHYRETGSNYRFDPTWLSELEKVSHRPYTTGFYFPEKNVEQEYVTDASYIRNYDFVGTIIRAEPESPELIVEARNYFAAGDELDIIEPGSHKIISFKAAEITDLKTGSKLKAAHNSYQVRIRTNYPETLIVKEGALLRRKKYDN